MYKIYYKNTLKLSFSGMLNVARNINKINKGKSIKNEKLKIYRAILIKRIGYPL